MFRTTIDQWNIFKTIIEENGLSAAAKKLNRSQPTISYSITKLQSQIGVDLITIEGKRCEITPAGKNLLQRVEPIIQQFAYLEQSANLLENGIEASIRLVVDNLFPKPILYRALNTFSLRYPNTDVIITEQIRLMPSTDIPYDLAICCPEQGLIVGEKLLEVTVAAVAHNEHPLFSNNKSNYTFSELTNYRQLYFEFSAVYADLIPKYQTIKSWNATSIEAGISAIKSNLCFGWVPTYMIQDELKQGTLLRIPLATNSEAEIPIYLIPKSLQTQGPAVRYLSKLLVAESHMI
ncbi:LysR family transcriptional regulator [Vibrio natriegens]|uniref:LysR family transcriptional regulator n=1 Tax=Vibrio natriegens TaxID=691 RepID=UPI0035564475